MPRRSDAPEDKAPAAQMRLDKWLWAARFFKTRQLAIDAINGGKVHLNGQRVKPGKDIGVGARLEISKDRYVWDITVEGLGSQRRPAPEAALLYRETPESLAKRQAEIQRQRDEKGPDWQPAHKPDKKDRRLIHRFKRGDE
ncbi:RNA-binding S4 domain-containing protein [Methylomagnum ishizawai]|uniref:RNA-binding S4 domain-containing protein n=1 Tax=Methylomagnum ishizawai TaxID=1760988 RepID=UPI001C32C13D|nr:S4 domain-containing protein [Methylomagnum ishizawai]BBL76307.1 heat-shock protein 15 [Methylomagnum ishizawai]